MHSLVSFNFSFFRRERYKIWYTHILMHRNVPAHAIPPIIFLSLQRLTLSKRLELLSLHVSLGYLHTCDINAS